MATYNLTATQLRAGGILNSFEIPAVGSFTNLYSTEYDGIDDYCKTNSTYSELDGLDNVAFSFWIKPTNASNARVICAIGNSQADTRAQQFQVWWYNNRIYIWFNGLSYQASSNTGVITLNQWQHVLVTRDSSRAINDKVRIYINGANQLNNENTRYWTNTTDATTGLYIGKHSGTYASHFLGFIDELAIYKQDMAAYISEIYSVNGAVDLNNLATAPSPTSWYRFEQGSGTTLTDSGDGGYNGTLENGVVYSTDVPT